MAHFNSRPARTSYALPYPGQIESYPVVNDIVKVLSGDLRGDMGVVKAYAPGVVKPYTVAVGSAEYQFSAPQLLPLH